MAYRQARGRGGRWRARSRALDVQSASVHRTPPSPTVATIDRIALRSAGGREHHAKMTFSRSAGVCVRICVYGSFRVGEGTSLSTGSAGEAEGSNPSPATFFLRKNPLKPRDLRFKDEALFQSWLAGLKSALFEPQRAGSVLRVSCRGGGAIEATTGLNLIGKRRSDAF